MIRCGIILTLYEKYVIVCGKEVHANIVSNGEIALSLSFRKI